MVMPPNFVLLCAVVLHNYFENTDLKRGLISNLWVIFTDWSWGYWTGQGSIQAVHFILICFLQLSRYRGESRALWSDWWGFELWRCQLPAMWPSATCFPFHLLEAPLPPPGKCDPRNLPCGVLVRTGGQTGEKPLSTAPSVRRVKMWTGGSFRFSALSCSTSRQEIFFLWQFKHGGAETPVSLESSVPCLRFKKMLSAVAYTFILRMKIMNEKMTK